MIPGDTGEFKVIGQLEEQGEQVCIWDRKTDNGFPDSKYLKQKVRNLMFDNKVSIGKHNERLRGEAGSQEDKEQPQALTLVKEDECLACQDI